ncbi:hypothetical protein GCM10027160_54960 [Streptomyces calidiresistens]
MAKHPTPTAGTPDGRTDRPTAAAGTRPRAGTRRGGRTATPTHEPGEPAGRPRRRTRRHPAGGTAAPGDPTAAPDPGEAPDASDAPGDADAPGDGTPVAERPRTDTAEAPADAGTDAEAPGTGASGDTTEPTGGTGTEAGTDTGTAPDADTTTTDPDPGDTPDATAPETTGTGDAAGTADAPEAADAGDGGTSDADTPDRTPPGATDEESRPARAQEPADDDTTPADRDEAPRDADRTPPEDPARPRRGTPSGTSGTRADGTAGESGTPGGTAVATAPRGNGRPDTAGTHPTDTDTADHLVDPYLDPGVEPEEAPMRAFDLLYARHAESLTRQTFLLCGDRRVATRAVVHAFRLAWERWPEVAVDRDPVGWVRAAAYEYALSPWHRLHPARVVRTGPRPSAARRDRARVSAHPSAPAGDGADGAAEDAGDTAPDAPVVPDEDTVLRALLSLPPGYRRCLLLHYGPGMGVTEIAAEVESSSAAVHGRLTRAHAMLVERVPELAEAPVGERRRLLVTALERIAENAPGRPVPEDRVREVCERLTRRRVLAAVLLILVISGAVVASVAPL